MCDDIIKHPSIHLTIIQIAAMSVRSSQFRAGFTLVEIMIVVAIITLLAAIVVPGFLRARKRSQATMCLNDVKVLDNATQQSAVENNCVGTDAIPQAKYLMPYLKPGSRMYSQSQATGTVSDTIGNQYIGTTFDKPIGINPATVAAFTDVIDNASSFWGEYLY